MLAWADRRYLYGHSRSWSYHQDLSRQCLTHLLEHSCRLPTIYYIRTTGSAQKGEKIRVELIVDYVCATIRWGVSFLLLLVYYVGSNEGCFNEVKFTYPVLATMFQPYPGQSARDWIIWSCPVRIPWVYWSVFFRLGLHLARHRWFWLTLLEIDVYDNEQTNERISVSGARPVCFCASFCDFV